MSTGLINIMKRASMDAVDNAQMCDLRYGTVISATPLKVQIDNLLTIPSPALVVPEHLTNYEVSVTTNWDTEDHTYSHTHNLINGDGNIEVQQHTNTHNHTIRGKKSMTIHNALKKGDKVVLIRKQGGQSYFILDRI